MKNVPFRQMIFSIFIISVLLNLPSCCPKVDCFGADDLHDIEFHNFAAGDLDTIVVKQYAKNSNFVSALSSSTIITDNLTDNPEYVAIILPNKIDINHDYTILLTSNGQIFTISEFEVKKQPCSTGFLCNNQYNALVDYKVNGVSQSLGLIRISK